MNYDDITKQPIFIICIEVLSMKYISLKKSRGTIQNRLDNIPKTHLIINNKIKPYRYKLNMMLFREK